jgi:hypothetical protein
MMPKEPREATRWGGGEWEPIKILLQELASFPSSNPNTKTLQKDDKHTNQQRRQYPLEDTNATEK